MESGLNVIFKLAYLKEQQREKNEKVLKSLQQLKPIKHKTLNL